MASVAVIDALPYMDPGDFVPGNSTTEYIQFNVYYCSFAQVGYVNRTAAHRFHDTSELDYVHFLCTMKTVLGDVLLWLAVVLGVPGNLVALATILTMCQSTSTFYICLLSLSDLVALTARASDILFARYQLQYTSALCQFMQFLTNFAITYSNWILVLICFERFITVRFPLQKSYYFTLRRARYSGLILAVLFLPVFLTFFFLTESNHGLCVSSPSMAYFYNTIFSRIVTALYLLIPATLLFLFTILVTVELRKHQKARRNLLTISPCRREDGVHNGQSHQELPSTRRRRVESEALGRSITIMMMFTAIVFLALSIPLCIVYLTTLDRNPVSESPSDYARNELIWKMVLFVNLLSHAVNFYIYFLSARKFRKQLFCLLMRRGSSVPPKPSLVSKSTRVNP